MKTDRQYKVYYSCKRDYSGIVPAIRLSGIWMEELGFQVGALINVHCEKGKLTIHLAEEGADYEEGEPGN